MSLSGNRGEWSELYAVLILLSTGRLKIVGSDLLPTGDEYEVIGVSRSYANGDVAYEIDLRNQTVRISDGDSKELVNLADIGDASQVILSKVGDHKGAGIDIPELEGLLARMRVHHLAANGRAKADLDLLVRDSRTGEVLRLSFSVKSQMGGAPTLLNASRATNFVLDLPFDRPQISSLEQLNGKPSLIVQKVLALNPRVDLPWPENAALRDNLRMVDTQMARIVGAMLLAYYSKNGTNVSDVVDWVVDRDPLDVGDSVTARRLYRHKVKTMLADFALAMFPSTPWDGSYSANGGYLLVDKNGGLGCIPAMHRDAFRDYLFSHTRMETASTSKHGFGHIETDPFSGLARIRLNLQIRFMKS